jgi:transcriptional regulator with XRE-family HTH domain
MLDGARVKEARLALGLLQENLATLLGVTRGTISKIEHEVLPGISLDLAERLAWALRRPLCTLLRGGHREHDLKPVDPSASSLN